MHLDRVGLGERLGGLVADAVGAEHVVERPERAAEAGPSHLLARRVGRVVEPGRGGGLDLDNAVGVQVDDGQDHQLDEHQCAWKKQIEREKMSAKDAPNGSTGLGK